MQAIPFYKPEIGEAEINEVVDTLRSGWLTTGPKTKRFEQEFSAYFGLKHAVALNSCTAALHLALDAIGLKEGQGVLVPTMTFAATAEVVRYFKGIPILVDCREADFNMDMADARRRLEEAKARGVEVVAIIPVHYGGQIVEVGELVRLAREHKLRIIEDAAHACPAFYREASEAPWQSVGSFSDVSCFSFYANKCITTGEGGMACAQSQELADRMRIMSLHGISRDAWKRFTADGSWYYEIVAPGFKYNLTDIASAIGIQQLRRADVLHVERTRVAETYASLLRDVEEVVLPVQLPNRIHSWHLYVIRLKLKQLSIDRAEFIIKLKERGIVTSVHWMPLHMHPYYHETYQYQPQDIPMAAGLYPEIISLPIFPSMTEGQIAYVAAAVRQIVVENLRPIKSVG
jgi:dTDP-4-amino-4,6-dideoxygalactose transaminase